MVSKQVVSGARVIAGLLVFSATVLGCSSEPPRDSENKHAAPVLNDQSSSQAKPATELTATEAAIAGAPANEVSSSTAPDAGIIKPGAPKSYVVKRGDTLWGIASLFLRDPWLWPEVWYINPQVNNPHLIYPGDTVALAYGANGQPLIRLEHGGGARMDPRLRSDPIDGAVPTVPYQAIAAFLSRPSILTRDQVKQAPYVVAFRDEHEIGGSNNEIYITKLSGPAHERYSVVHVGDPLRDPDNGDVIGYQGVYTGTALVSKPGQVTKAVLVDTERETLRGDKVMAVDTDVPLNFAPSAPRNPVKGRIIAVVDGTALIGQYQIVAINRGTRDGVSNGTVLAIDQAGESVRDVYSNGLNAMFGDPRTSFSRHVKLPDERVGTLLVFKTFNRVAYALIVGASNTIHVQDIVHNP